VRKARCWPFVAADPFVALVSTIILISLLYFLLESQTACHEAKKSDHLGRCFQRAWWALLMVPLLVLPNMILGTSGAPFSVYVIVAASGIAQLLFFHWALEKRVKALFFLPGAAIFSLGLGIFLPAMDTLFGLVSGVAVFFSVPGLFLLFLFSAAAVYETTDSWTILLDHPARLLLFTFLALCALGTFLLVLPVSTRTGTIDLIDAAFTAVSAVCVTGLIVLDTPYDFTGAGQFFIVILIQLGGLGIMGIATVALYAMGRRLSLRQERLMSSITATEQSDLFQSLATILKFTFLVEGLGALLLAIAFYHAGDSLAYALWRGLFTAVSAFCNAGFAL
jgi:trk system potassium uptake protein